MQFSEKRQSREQQISYQVLNFVYYTIIIVAQPVKSHATTAPYRHILFGPERIESSYFLFQQLRYQYFNSFRTGHRIRLKSIELSQGRQQLGHNKTRTMPRLSLNLETKGPLVKENDEAKGQIQMLPNTIYDIKSKKEYLTKDYRCVQKRFWCLNSTLAQQIDLVIYYFFSSICFLIPY